MGALEQQKDDPRTFKYKKYEEIYTYDQETVDLLKEKVR